MTDIFDKGEALDGGTSFLRGASPYAELQSNYRLPHERQDND